MHIFSETVVVVSLGNELRGDDGAGILFGRLLAASGTIRVIEGGTAPENVTGDIVRAGPSRVLIADAAEMGATPGEFQLLNPLDLTFDCASTHTTTALWCEYILQMTGARLCMIGFQPVSLAFGDILTPVVEQGVRTAADRCLSLGVELFISALQEGVAHETALYRVGGR